MLTDRDHANLFEHPNPFDHLFRQIAESAQNKLRASPYCELWDVSCDFSGGILTLAGSIPTDDLKRLAEACVAEIPGVLLVDNRVEVVERRPSGIVDANEHEALVPVPTVRP